MDEGLDKTFVRAMDGVNGFLSMVPGDRGMVRSQQIIIQIY